MFDVCLPSFLAFQSSYTLCVQDTESTSRHDTADCWHEGGKEQISLITLGVYMGCSEAMICSRVEALDGGIIDSKLTDPTFTVHVWWVTTPFHIHKKCCSLAVYRHVLDTLIF